MYCCIIYNVKYRLQGTFYCPTNGKKVPIEALKFKSTFYWSPTFYFQIKSQTPVKSLLHIQKHFSLKPIFYLNFNAFDWYLFAPCSLQTRQY